MNTTTTPAKMGGNLPPEQDESVTALNRVEKAREFFEFATQPPNDTVLRRDRTQAWGQLWLIKQKAKYGWDKLGFTDAEARRIKLNKPDWV